MPLSWKSTINTACIHPKGFPIALEQTIPGLIKEEIQHLANLSLFQQKVLSSNNNKVPQVPVYLKVTKNSLNMRVSDKGSWVTLLPSSSQALTPEEEAVDAVRREVMRKIAVIWSEASKSPCPECAPNKNSARSYSKESYAESSTISRKKIDYSVDTINNYHRLSYADGEEEKGQNPKVDPSLQPDFKYPIFKEQNVSTKNQSNPGASEDESKHSSKNSFSSNHQKEDTSSAYPDTRELEDSSGKKSKLTNPEIVETFLERPHREETFDSDTEEGFTMMPSSSELTEEMEYIPPVKTNITSRIKKIWRNVTNINLFNSKTWNVTNSVENTRAYSDEQNHSNKDFQILPPIIKDLKNMPIDPTSLSIRQIKKDLSRMKICINNFHCVNIKDFITHLGLTLNSEETDIVERNYHPIIPKILHFAHQGLFSSGIKEIWTKITTLSNNNLMPCQLDNSPTLDIQWNPEFPEQTKILGETYFQLNYLREEPHLVPDSTHLLKIQSSFQRQEEEITFTKIPQKTTGEGEDNFEMIEPTETVKKSGNEFTIDSFEANTKAIEASSDDTFENIDIVDNEGEFESTFKNTFDYLFTKTNSPLRPGITSEYLQILKNKYPNFIYDDRLMYGNIPVSMDTIIDFLTSLKIEHPGNQVIFFPFLVKGWTVDHAVVGVVNLSNKTIEYFDPKGQSRFTTRIEKQSNKNVFDFLTEIGKKVISPTFSKESIIYNKKNVPQKILDNINCGVFCLQFMEERFNHSFQAIENGLVGKLTNPVHIRHQLAKKFQERFETEKIHNFSLTNSTHSPEEEKVKDTHSMEDPESSLDSQIPDSYEFIPSSTIQNIPLSPMSTISQKSIPPLFFTPKNPLHLGKYSHLLQTIKENFSKFSSNTNLISLKTILYQDSLDSRDKYRKYVEELRKLIQDTTLDKETRTNIEKLCYAQFTMNVMTNFIEHFLQQATDHKLKSASELTMYTIADAIIATNNQLKDSSLKKALTALYSQKLAGELGINFDPIKYSNIPEIRSIHTVRSSSKKEPYQIIYMRHGTPTIETGLIHRPQDTDNLFGSPLRRFGSTLFKNYQANTIPEYGAFLNRARDVNTPVFYVNHQSMINKTSSESSRSRAIQTHETTHPDHFFFMTLPLDGRVLNYIESTNQWKKELIDSVINERNGFILPTKLKNDFAKDKQILENQFKDLLDQLHNLYFANQSLGPTDQYTLLMIFYSYLKDFVKERYQIQLMVSACKDNKDRGNTSSSIDEVLYNLRLGKENDSHALYDLYIRFFAPFIIKYNHIIPHRFKLLISVLQHISTLTDTQKQAIRQFQINNFEILDQKVPR